MFEEEIKNFWKREKEEIQKNRLRIGVLLCTIFAGIFSLIDFDEGEEVILTDSPKTEIAEEKNLSDKKISTVATVSEENITPVIGANSETLFVRDPFKVIEVESVKKEEINNSQSANLPISQSNNLTQPSLPPQQKNFSTQETTEKFILTGTATTPTGNTALVQHYKGKNLSETFILSVGDTLKGQRIVEITENFLLLDGGEKLYIMN